MSANHSSQQGVPCIWLALGKASLTPRHGITFVPLREVGRPRPSTHRCNWMLAICLRCIKLTVRDSHPLDMLNLSPVGVAFTQFVGLQRKSGFLQASPVHKPSLKLCLRLTVPEKQPIHDPTLVYGRLACKWRQLSQQKRRFILHHVADHAIHVPFPHDHIRAHDLSPRVPTPLGVLGRLACDDLA